MENGINEEGKEVMWSWPKFWIGKLSNKFIAMIISTVLVFITLFHNGWTNPISEVVIIAVWGLIMFIYMLPGAMEMAVSNMKISAELKAGASINKNIATNAGGQRGQ